MAETSAIKQRSTKKKFPQWHCVCWVSCEDFPLVHCVVSAAAAVDGVCVWKKLIENEVFRRSLLSSIFFLLKHTKLLIFLDEAVEIIYDCLWWDTSSRNCIVCKLCWAHWKWKCNFSSRLSSFSLLYFQIAFFIAFYWLFFLFLSVLPLYWLTSIQFVCVWRNPRQSIFSIFITSSTLTLTSSSCSLSLSAPADREICNFQFSLLNLKRIFFLLPVPRERAREVKLSFVEYSVAVDDDLTFSHTASELSIEVSWRECQTRIAALQDAFQQDDIVYRQIPARQLACVQCKIERRERVSKVKCENLKCRFEIIVFCRIV